jgi:pimeloyl-ACP methyl ester carboxylesterase
MSSHVGMVAAFPKMPDSFGSRAASLSASADIGGGETRYLEVEGGRVAYDDLGGDGLLVLGIPGLGDLRSEYRFVRPALKQAGYRVVTMDVRGHGGSSTQWVDYSAHAVGRDALALIAHLTEGPAVILGNSFAAGSAM